MVCMLALIVLNAIMEFKTLFRGQKPVYILVYGLAYCSGKMVTTCGLGEPYVRCPLANGRPIAKITWLSLDNDHHKQHLPKFQAE